MDFYPAERYTKVMHTGIHRFLVRFLCLGACLLCPAVLALFAAVPARSQSFTMAGAVEKALASNPGMDAARSGVRAAESGVRAARAAFGPEAGLSYAWKWEQKPGLASGVRRSGETYIFGVGLIQNVFNGFKDLNQLRRAELETVRRTETLRAERLNLAYQVQSVYLEYLKAVEHIRSARDSLERLQSQLDMTRAFYAEGLRPRLDVLQAEVDVSSAESVLLQAENTRLTLAARLNALLALEPGAQVEYTGDLDPVPFMLDLQTCLAGAFQARPDLRAADLAAVIAGRERDIIRGDYLPTVSAEAAWTTEGDTFSASGGRGLETDFNAWSAGVTAGWTLFSWGATRHAEQQAAHEQRRLRSDALGLRDEVTYEVTSRLLAVRNAEKRIVVARKAVEQAREAYRTALALYRNQVGTNLDVLDAQSTLTLEEAGLTGVKADYLSALAGLYAAMGEIRPDLRAETPPVRP